MFINPEHCVHLLVRFRTDWRAVATDDLTNQPLLQILTPARTASRRANIRADTRNKTHRRIASTMLLFASYATNVTIARCLLELRKTLNVPSSSSTWRRSTLVLLEVLARSEVLHRSHSSRDEHKRPQAPPNFPIFDNRQHRNPR